MDKFFPNPLTIEYQSAKLKPYGKLQFVFLKTQIKKRKKEKTNGKLC